MDWGQAFRRLHGSNSWSSRGIVVRRLIIGLLLWIPALACVALDGPVGRWEGPIQIPGRALHLVVDLSQDSSGTWIGSIILQGLGIKGAPLSNLAVTDTDVAFDIGSLLSSPTYGAAHFHALRTGADGMSGEMSQGGNAAKFSLTRIAPAQVEPAPRSTAVGRDLAGRWIGEFELGGYPRHVTITVESHGDAAATAQFVVVGKQTTNLPVDLVAREGDFLRIESQANQVAFEGRVFMDRGEIQGIVEMGPLELPLVLRRFGGSGS